MANKIPLCFLFPCRHLAARKDQSYKHEIISMVTGKPCLTLQHVKKYIQKRRKKDCTAENSNYDFQGSYFNLVSLGAVDW